MTCKCDNCKFADGCKKKDSKPIKKTIIWKELIHHKIDPDKYVLTYAPGYEAIGLLDQIYKVQKGKDVKPDVLMWGYIENPVDLH